MKLEGDYRFDASVQEVWDALFDPVILAAVMPGCEKLERVGEHFVGEIKVKVGPVQGKFTGKVELLDRDEPRRYRMVVDGRGTAGFVKANATVELAAADGGTRIRYDADAQVGGKLASVGQRLLEASTKAIVAQSLEGLHENIKLRAAAYRAAAAQAAAGEPAAVVAAAAVVTAAEPAAVVVAAPEPAAAVVVVPEPATAVVAAVSTVPEAPAPAPAPVPAPAPAPVAFTPVKVTSSAVAKSVAKEVAKTVAQEAVRGLFKTTLLLAIIAIQFAVILYLLLR